MINRPQLDFVRQKVDNGEQPWAAAYDAMLRDKFMMSSRDPSAHEVVECGQCSKPNVGCIAERHDSLAAYGNALAWAISGSEEYAVQAMRIMNAYSSTIKGHNNSHAPLQSG